MPPSDGIYRIYHGSTNLALTLSRPNANNSLQYVLGYFDDQDPAANAYQQWIVKYWAQSKTYTLLNVGGGLYFTYTMDPNGWHYSRGSKKPFHITLQPESGQDTFSFNLKPTKYYMKFEGAAPGSRTVLLGEDAGLTAGPLRNWIFRRAQQTATPKPAPPLPTVAPLRSDTYRIINTSGRTYLAQKRDIAANYIYPTVVGQRYISEDTYQQWIVTLHEPSQTYFLKNKGSGRWLSTVDKSRRDAAPNEFATVTEAPVHWDIRQGEIENGFVVHQPGVGTACVMQLESGSVNDNARVLLMTRRDAYTSTWETWRFEPVNAAVSATTNPPLPFYGSLKTGTYYIRNRSTWGLLTQEQVNSTADAQVLDPRLIGTTFQAGNDFQKWKVSFNPDLKQYSIQNVGSNRYASYAYALYNNLLIGAGQNKVWNILQSEQDEDFLIHAPGNQQVISLSAGKGVMETRGVERSYFQQRWIFEPVDPKGADLKDPNDTNNYNGDNMGSSSNWGEKEAKEYVANQVAANVSDGSVANYIKNFLTGTAITYKVQTPLSKTPITGEAQTTGSAEQIWEFKESGENPGEYYIYNDETQTVLSYTETPKDGEYLTVSQDPVSRFNIKTDGDKSFLLIVPNTGLAVYLESTSPGSGVYLKYARNTDGFKWEPKF